MNVICWRLKFRNICETQFLLFRDFLNKIKEPTRKWLFCFNSITRSVELLETQEYIFAKVLPNLIFQ